MVLLTMIKQRTSGTELGLSAKLAQRPTIELSLSPVGFELGYSIAIAGARL